jgi:hypothetical protein
MIGFGIYTGYTKEKKREEYDNQTNALEYTRLVGKNLDK